MIIEYRNATEGITPDMLEKLKGIPCIDLTCDPALPPFYSRVDMQPSARMFIRDY